MRSSFAKYDIKKAATNVSLYLCFSAFSSLLSSYFGGYLLDYLTPQQMFIVTAVFPVFTIISGIIVFEVKIPPQT